MCFSCLFHASDAVIVCACRVIFDKLDDMMGELPLCSVLPTPLWANSGLIVAAQWLDLMQGMSSAEREGRECTRLTLGVIRMR